MLKEHGLPLILTSIGRSSAGVQMKSYLNAWKTFDGIFPL